jgi:nucleoside-diphosphate-sugar epimerase
MQGVYGVYSVQDYRSVGARRGVQQGKNLADAAKKAGVAHFVYSSVGGAERNSGIDHWEFYQMFRWFNTAGFNADIEGLRRRFLEIHLRSLEEWLRDEGWHKRARHVRAPRG